MRHSNPPKTMSSSQPILDDSVAVVTNADQFIRWSTRADIHKNHLPHRSIHVMLIDQQQRLIVQQRHAQKATYPSYWDVACSGHVEYSDYPKNELGIVEDPNAHLEKIYQQVAHRELAEELGVDTALTYLASFMPEADVHYECFRLYVGRWNGGFTLQSTEVAQVSAIAYADWDQWIQEHSCTLTLKMLGHFIRQKQVWHA